MENKDIYAIFSAPISHPSYISFIQQILPYCTGRDRRLYLAFDSRGGDINVGVLMYNVLKSLPISLTTHNIGSVDSVANVVFLAGEHRFCAPSATFAFHSSGFFPEPNVRVDERLLLEWIDKVQVRNKSLTSILKDRTKLTDDMVSDLLREEKFMTAEWALEHGVIDKINSFEVPDGAHYVAHMA